MVHLYGNRERKGKLDEGGRIFACFFFVTRVSLLEPSQGNAACVAPNSEKV